MKTILILLSIATSALSQGLYFGSSVPAAIGPTNWVTGGVPTGTFQPTRVVVGCQFTPTANITVTALGFWVHLTTEDNIPLGIYGDTGTLLGTVTLKVSNYSNGTMGYTNLASSVPLTAGIAYRIAGLPGSAGLSGGYYDDTGAAPSIATDATLNSSCYVAGSVLAFPSTLSASGKMYGPVSFIYTRP